MSSRSENFRRILGRVVQQDFVGRAGELDRIMAQAEPVNAGRGLLLLMEPSAGVSELLRQAYDRLFNVRSDVIPIYFAITPSETTAVSAAIEFFNTFVQQYIAFRRKGPVDCHAPLNLPDLPVRALPVQPVQLLHLHRLFGGHVHRHFAELLEEISPRLDTRHLLIRLLWEAAAGEEQVSSFEVWRKRLHMAVNELEDVLHRLHVQEFINWDGATVEAGAGPQAWKDYLKIRYRLDVLNEPRESSDSL